MTIFSKKTICGKNLSNVRITIYIQRKMKGYIGFMIYKVMNSIYHDDSVNSVFTLVLDDFHQNNSHRNVLKG